MSKIFEDNELSDEEFLQAIEEASTIESEEEEETETKVETEDFEDTNQSEEFEESNEEDPETKHQDDENDVESGENESNEAEETEEENTQVETSSEKDENEEANDIESNSEESESNLDKSETNENPVEDGKETDGINYEEQYKQLLENNKELEQFKNFYDEVTSEFTANGKKIKGFTDPKKVIESQQMAAGYSDKMHNFKQYRPFMNTLKEKGMLSNPEKFNLAMNLLDGDQEAIKQHIKNLEIDPFEMDMENINYNSKNQVSSNLEIAFDDIIENAETYNVKEEVEKVISKDWDDQSVITLLEDPQSSADLVNHISTGAYDIVNERIAEKKRTDVNGVFNNKPMIEQYREAASELEVEYIDYVNTQQQNQKTEKSETNDNAVQNEVDKIEQERKEQDYRSKVEKQNAKADEARKKATSVSKKKPRAKPNKKVFDPGTASDEEFTAMLDKAIFG